MKGLSLVTFSNFPLPILTWTHSIRPHPSLWNCSCLCHQRPPWLIKWSVLSLYITQPSALSYAVSHLLLLASKTYTLLVSLLLSGLYCWFFLISPPLHTEVPLGSVTGSSILALYILVVSTLCSDPPPQFPLSTRLLICTKGSSGSKISQWVSTEKKSFIIKKKKMQQGKDGNIE